MTGSQPWNSQRHLTAIGRSGLSMPARVALQDGVVTTDHSFFDYGSGRGQDVQRLRAMGYQASGWDPHFEAHRAPTTADTVMLSYVLNVIEDPSERLATLQEAWRLARRTLVVASRLSWDRRRVNGTPTEDGVMTSRSTFQHLYTPSELRNFVEGGIGERCVSPTPGVLYVFRSDAGRLAYLARSAMPQFAWANPEDLAQGISEATAFARLHGRVPTLGEIPSHVIPVLGGVSSVQLNRLVRRAIDPDQWTAGAKRATLDALLYLGMAIFQGRPRLSDLPETTRLDVRAHFGSYREACARADRLLLKLRDDSYVRGAMRNSVGKLTPTALYVHRRARDAMPIVLRLYEYCGSVAAGRPEEWNILKLHHDDHRVAWSSYPEFDRDPHPRLAWTYSVHLGTLESSFRAYWDSPNRPLLHRKQEFLARDDECYARYAKLTESELRAGLYNEPSTIGLEHGWNESLRRCGVELRGHRVVKANGQSRTSDE